MDLVALVMSGQAERLRAELLQRRRRAGDGGGGGGLAGDLNRRGAEDGKAPLHIATYLGSHACLRVLLEQVPSFACFCYA